MKTPTVEEARFLHPTFVRLSAAMFGTKVKPPSDFERGFIEGEKIQRAKMLALAEKWKWSNHLDQTTNKCIDDIQSLLTTPT